MRRIQFHCVKALALGSAVLTAILLATAARPLGEMAGAPSAVQNNRAQDNFYLRDGDRVVFYGDSITDQRLYTTFVETYVVTRFPRLKVSFVHSGWGGDRVTGGGGGPIDVRLRRDVIAYRPSVMTIMLGMNDASYRPYDAQIFSTYAEGYRHILSVVKSALPGVRVTLIEPSPFDDVTRPPQFEGGYNAVLVRYGEFVKQLAEREGLTVADMNTPVVAALQKANAERVRSAKDGLDADLAQKIVPDRVHPGPGGHLLMAEALLKAWHAPATVSAVEIDAPSTRVVQAENTTVTGLDSANGVAWTQTDDALPMPVNPLNDPVVALAVRSSDFVEALDRQELKVTGLSAPRYDLKIDGEEVGTFSNQQLGEGINLAVLATPMAKQAMAVHELTLKHNNIHFARWRQIQVPLEKEESSHKEGAIQTLDLLESDLILEQRATAQPKARRYSLTPQ